MWPKETKRYPYLSSLPPSTSCVRASTPVLSISIPLAIKKHPLHSFSRWKERPLSDAMQTKWRVLHLSISLFHFSSVQVKLLFLRTFKEEKEMKTEWPLQIFLDPNVWHYRQSCCLSLGCAWRMVTPIGCTEKGLSLHRRPHQNKNKERKDNEREK